MRVFLSVALMTACSAPQGEATDARLTPFAVAPSPAPRGETATSPASPPRTEPADGGALSAARTCFAAPLAFEPSVSPKPLPAHVAAWLAELDAAVPELAPGGAAMLRARFGADETRAMMQPEEDMRFTAARTFFEHQHWADAGLRFRALAVRSPPGSTGIFAAQLYLECLNVVYAKVRPARPACLDAIVSDSEAFLALHCRPDPRQNVPEACAVLERIPAEVARLRGHP